MTIEEFSNNFDTYFSTTLKSLLGVNAQQASVSEYDKSVFLTRAQENFILSLYRGDNSVFENTEETRRYVSTLLRDVSIKDEIYEDRPLTLSKKSHFYRLPDDVWFVILEFIRPKTDDKCNDDFTISVTPALHDEWNNLKSNPFRGANSRRALRFDVRKNVVEIVAEDNIKEYCLRYLARPKPIILIPLMHDDLTIEGCTEVSGCELPESVHDKILLDAVSMAVSPYANAAANKTVSQK